ncbi:MAG: hypothetical protein IJ151_06125 [Bacteroidales bacterium]|nr:hypothetical protein [Bacteroidales bacterium]
MDNNDINYKTEVLLRMVNEDHIYLCPAFDFYTVCKLLEVAPEAMDESLSNTIGHDGNTLFRLMKSGYISYIGKKYCLNVGNAR